MNFMRTLELNFDLFEMKNFINKIYGYYGGRKKKNKYKRVPCR